jgi:hypothetical protein
MKIKLKITYHMKYEINIINYESHLDPSLSHAACLPSGEYVVRTSFISNSKSLWLSNLCMFLSGLRHLDNSDDDIY